MNLLPISLSPANLAEDRTATAWAEIKTLTVRQNAKYLQTFSDAFDIIRKLPSKRFKPTSSISC